MLRLALTLVMAGMQAVLAAPLYVCTSVRGAVALDGGMVLCAVSHARQTAHQHTGCCGQHDHHSWPSPPCDCEHEPLGTELQQVRRAETVPSGGLLVTALIAIECPHESCQSVTSASAWPPDTLDSAPLAELATVQLRC